MEGIFMTSKSQCFHTAKNSCERRKW